ncbi:MAG: DUF3052 domain-containing protein [Gemmatimonadetes bacterium]|nr:MAG: DUF3052 domain-containing protein [Gemmatimonadota bacterium]
MAGYSRRSLVEKLGIKSHTRIAILNAPRGYRATLGALPPGVRVTSTIRGTFSFIHVFSRSQAELRSRLAALLRALEPAGALWISWPKKSSGFPTDMSEDAVREIALPSGLVDIKVAAVDGVWSGLKLVRRLRNR